MRTRPSTDVIQRGITAMGCPVCFTGGDPLLRDSLTAGIGVLVVVTLVVLTCFAAFFVMLARRAADAAAPDQAVAPSLPPLPERAR